MDTIIIEGYNIHPAMEVIRNRIIPNPEHEVFVFDDNLLYYPITFIYKDRPEYHTDED